MSLAKRVHHKALREVDLARLRLTPRPHACAVCGRHGPDRADRQPERVHLPAEARGDGRQGARARTARRRCSSCLQARSSRRRYLRAFGMRRFVELPDYVDDARRGGGAARGGDAAVGQADRPATSAGLTFRGAAIGRYVLSTVSRSLHEGTVDFARARERGPCSTRCSASRSARRSQPRRFSTTFGRRPSSSSSATTPPRRRSRISRSSVA